MSAKIAAKVRLSWNVDNNRSVVTSPPMRIPANQFGRANWGRVKIVVPGIGTPMRIPITRRMTITIKPMRSDQKKVFRQGVNGARCATNAQSAPIKTRSTAMELIRQIAIESAIAQIHQAKGWRSCFIYIFCNCLGVSIDAPHSLAG